MLRSGGVKRKRAKVTSARRSDGRRPPAAPPNASGRRCRTQRTGGRPRIFDVPGSEPPVTGRLHGVGEGSRFGITAERRTGQVAAGVRLAFAPGQTADQEELVIRGVG